MKACYINAYTSLRAMGPEPRALDLWVSVRDAIPPGLYLGKRAGQAAAK